MALFLVMIGSGQETIFPKRKHFSPIHFWCPVRTGVELGKKRNNPLYYKNLNAYFENVV